MSTFLAVFAALAAWLLIGTATLLLIARWAHHHQPPADTATPPSTGAAWAYVCSCAQCQEAAQPSTTVAPCPDRYGHEIPRDTFAHDESGDCVCGPDVAWSVAGPYYVHRSSREFAA